MSDPELQPIRDAFAAADMVGPKEKPPVPNGDIPGPLTKSDSEREADAKSILYLFKKHGRDQAWACARALRWSEEEFVDIITPKKKSSRSVASAADGAGGGVGDPPPPDAEPGEEGFFKKSKIPIKLLPEDCPVRPLGVKGEIYFYMNPLNELADIKGRDHNAMVLRTLFRDQGAYLHDTWPKFSAATGNQNGWAADKCAESLMNAAAKKGVIDGYAIVRGLGAWPDDKGRLIAHFGDRVMIDGDWHAPGAFEDHIYPAHEKSPKPAETAKGFEELFAHMLDLFDTWNWQGERDENGVTMDRRAGKHALESLLMFGWIAAACFGGALKWRPMMWLTGDAGSGKSHLFDLVKHVLGDLVRAENATPAGVWTVLGASTRPVLLDEAENDPSSPKNKRLIELARLAASGGLVLRGSADHKSAQFQARSAFLFSSIIIPPMGNQDVSRFCVLDMGPITGKAALKLDSVRLAAAGAALRRRLIDRWRDCDAVVEAWRQTLAGQGHSARSCDQYGALFGMADLALYDETTDSDTRTEICGLIRPDRQATTDADSMLNFLITIPLDVFRGGTRMTIGQLVTTASARIGAMDDLAGDSPANPESCARALVAHGVYVTRDDGFWRVVLPNKHEGLRRLFEQSRWRTDPGMSGGWAQSMRRLPQSRPVSSTKYGGRGWSVPVDVFLMREEAK